ncbi:MAG: hypothetical protein QNK83_00975 [Akkermansiaceae bacterium]
MNQARPYHPRSELRPDLLSSGGKSQVLAIRTVGDIGLGSTTGDNADTQWTYTFGADDLGVNPSAAATGVIKLTFALCASVELGEFVSNTGNDIMLEFGFGGTAGSEAVRLGVTSSNELYYFNTSSSSWSDAGYDLNPFAFEGIAVTMDLDNGLWNIDAGPSSGSTLTNLVTGVTMENKVGSSFGDWTITTHANDSTGSGFEETYVDNFNFIVSVPRPSSSALLGLSALALVFRRKK